MEQIKNFSELAENYDNCVRAAYMAAAASGTLIKGDYAYFNVELPFKKLPAEWEKVADWCNNALDQAEARGGKRDRGFTYNHISDNLKLLADWDYRIPDYQKENLKDVGVTKAVLTRMKDLGINVEKVLHAKVLKENVQEWIGKGLIFVPYRKKK